MEQCSSLFRNELKNNLIASLRKIVQYPVDAATQNEIHYSVYWNIQERRVDMVDLCNVFVDDWKGFHVDLLLNSLEDEKDVERLIWRYLDSDAQDETLYYLISGIPDLGVQIGKDCHEKVAQRLQRLCVGYAELARFVIQILERQQCHVYVEVLMEWMRIAEGKDLSLLCYVLGEQVLHSFSFCKSLLEWMERNLENLEKANFDVSVYILVSMIISSNRQFKQDAFSLVSQIITHDYFDVDKITGVFQSEYISEYLFEYLTFQMHCNGLPIEFMVTALVRVFVHCPPSRSTILKKIFETLKSHPDLDMKDRYFLILDQIILKHAFILCDTHLTLQIQHNLEKLREYPLETGKRLLTLLIPLMVNSPQLCNHVYMLLRKFISSRRSHDRVLGIFGLTQSLMQGRISRILSEDSIMEALRPAFFFHTKIRSVLYENLCICISELSNESLQLLHDNVYRKLYNLFDGQTTELKLHEVGGDYHFYEPVGSLFQLTTYLHLESQKRGIQKTDHDFDPIVYSKERSLKEYLQQIVEQLTNPEVICRGLQDSADLVKLLPLIPIYISLFNMKPDILHTTVEPETEAELLQYFAVSLHFLLAKKLLDKTIMDEKLICTLLLSITTNMAKERSTELILPSVIVVECLELTTVESLKEPQTITDLLTNLFGLTTITTGKEIVLKLPSRTSLAMYLKDRISQAKVNRIKYSEKLILKLSNTLLERLFFVIHKHPSVTISWKLMAPNFDQDCSVSNDFDGLVNFARHCIDGLMDSSAVKFWIQLIDKLSDDRPVLSESEACKLFAKSCIEIMKTPILKGKYCFMVLCIMQKFSDTETIYWLIEKIAEAYALASSKDRKPLLQICSTKNSQYSTMRGFLAIVESIPITPTPLRQARVVVDHVHTALQDSNVLIRFQRYIESCLKSLINEYASSEHVSDNCKECTKIILELTQKILQDIENDQMKCSDFSERKLKYGFTELQKLSSLKYDIVLNKKRNYSKAFNLRDEIISKRQKQSTHSYINKHLGQETGTDTFEDLRDFLVE